jgi:hypothetical protein
MLETLKDRHQTNGSPWFSRLGVGREANMLALQNSSCKKNDRLRVDNLEWMCHKEVKALKGRQGQGVSKKYVAQLV